LCLSCGAPGVAVERPAPVEGSGLRSFDVEVTGAERAPSLRAQIPWSNREALFGSGAVRVWGTPREDELRVHAIVDAPARARRWGQTCEVRVTVDGRELALPASYVGRPMSSGVYDAVRVTIGIEEVRAIASANRVEGRVCGDTLEIGVEQRATLRRFVEQFDRLAVPGGPSRGVELPIGPDLLLPGEEADNWPTPA
jgi:hypothetical protein